MTWARGSYDSVYGRIASSWKHESGQFTLNLSIPANTTATVTVPTRDFEAITESGKTIAKARGVRFLRTENNAAVYEVGSGTYQFKSPF
jgi:alpha-L-rhamnosidase